MGGPAPYEVVVLDPPVPVKIVGFRKHPSGLLRWERSGDGWSGVVRSVVHKWPLSPDGLDDALRYARFLQRRSGGCT